MKKILSYILILCFIFTLITNVFADVQGTWNSDCSDYVKNGIRDNSGFLSTFNDKFIWAIRTPKGYAHVSNSYNMGLSGAALALDKKINIWGYKVGDPQSNYTKTEIEVIPCGFTTSMKFTVVSYTVFESTNDNNTVITTGWQQESGNWYYYKVKK